MAVTLVLVVVHGVAGEDGAMRRANDFEIASYDIFSKNLLDGSALLDDRSGLFPDSFSPIPSRVRYLRLGYP